MATFVCAFITRHKLAIKNRVRFYRVISLHYTMHMLEHNFTRVFENSAKLVILKIYHRAYQNTVFERRFDDAPTESIPHMSSSTHRFLQILEPRDTCDCLLPILIIVGVWYGSAPPVILYKFVASLFPCAVLFSCIKQLAESNPCYQLRCWID